MDGFQLPKIKDKLNSRVYNHTHISKIPPIEKIEGIDYFVTNKFRLTQKFGDKNLIIIHNRKRSFLTRILATSRIIIT